MIDMCADYVFTLTLSRILIPGITVQVSVPMNI
uniref:Uncharacterized protein n=1 Tax=Arundo donax TaxID=35708 RepID=A0A0A9DV51_ARUDO